MALAAGLSIFGIAWSEAKRKEVWWVESSVVIGYRIKVVGKQSPNAEKPSEVQNSTRTRTDGFSGKVYVRQSYEPKGVLLCGIVVMVGKVGRQIYPYGVFLSYTPSPSPKHLNEMVLVLLPETMLLAPEQNNVFVGA